MNKCNEIQKLIAELSCDQVIKDKNTLKHIENCQQCQAYQQARNDMHEAMMQMNDFDADDALVESTLSSILSLQEETKKAKPILTTQWASALAASFMLISLIALFPYNSISDYGLISSTPEVVDKLIPQEDKKDQKLKKTKLRESDFEFFDVEVADEVVTKYRKLASKPAIINQKMTVKPELLQRQEFLSSMQAHPLAKDDTKELMDKLSKGMDKNIKEELGQSRYVRSSRPVGKSDTQRQDKLNNISTNTDYFVEADGEACCDDDKVELDRVVTTGSRIRMEDLEEPAVISSIDRESRERKGRQNFNVAMGSASDKSGILLQGQYVPPDDESQPMGNKSKNKYQISSEDLRVNNLVEEEKQETNKSLNPAQKYLTDINSLQNLTFQTASGYWANTYIPGDSKMRLLRNSLIQNQTIDVDNSISQNIQPFDYPENAALAVYLSSDHAYIDQSKATHMRLQVGIQAANRKGGHRTDMNIGLVFDLTNKDTQYFNKMKALLTALLNSKQPGDNISLTIAGAPGAVLLEPKDFRHGPIQVALHNLFTKKTPKDEQALTLKQALQRSSEALQKIDDPTTSLGSSTIILFSANSIENLSELETMVHQGAIAGITLSTVSMEPINRDALNKLAQAGQGHARILQSEHDAKRVIDAELLASSRAVARALRLRIRLAKGVKLIKVIDSYNLNTQQSQRVRDAEKSLDKRLSQNLGISADRGEDEEGIQIVIPSFFADDTHVILLDVVATKAGALADVSLRYKDLLYLRNAVTRKQLNLQSTFKALGPLQLNVMKNVLAQRFARSIKQASSLIRTGNKNQALSKLLEMQKLYKSMRAKFPSWNNDVEIEKDESLLQQYISLLNSNSITDAKQINYIADSMQYISWRKNITKTE